MRKTRKFDLRLHIKAVFIYNTILQKYVREGMKPISSNPTLQEKPIFSFLDLALCGGKGDKFNEFILFHHVADLIYD